MKPDEKDTKIGYHFMVSSCADRLSPTNRNNMVDYLTRTAACVDNLIYFDGGRRILFDLTYRISFQSIWVYEGKFVDSYAGTLLYIKDPNTSVEAVYTGILTISGQQAIFTGDLLADRLMNPSILAALQNEWTYRNTMVIKIKEDKNNAK